MKTTTITDPEGRTTTIQERHGCCGGCLATMAALFLVGAPLEFPLPLMILAYIVEGVVLVALVAAAVQRA